MRTKRSLKFFWVLGIILLTLITTSSVSSDDGTTWLPSPGGTKCGAVFGNNNPAGGQTFHNARDFCGGQDVKAVANGQVVWNSWWPPSKESAGTGHGITTIIYHPESNVYSYSAHMDRVDVELYQEVERGQILGPVGTTGYMKVKNKHIHFAISIFGPEVTSCWDTSCWQDPFNFLGQAASQLPKNINQPLTPSEDDSWDLGTAGLVFTRPPSEETFELVPVISTEPEKPTLSSVSQVVITDQDIKEQSWFLLAGVFVSAVLLIKREPFGFFTTCCMAAWVIFLAQPVYAEQETTYIMETAPRQMIEKNVAWEITLPGKSTESNLNDTVESLSPNQTPPSLNGCQELSKFPYSIQRWCTWVVKYATKNDLDPALVAAMMWQESGGDPNVISHSGAVGLIQVMASDGLSARLYPGTFNDRPTVSELKVPEYNIKYSTNMMRGLENEYGSIRDALLHYGPMDVGYYYADLILKLYNQYKN